MEKSMRRGDMVTLPPSELQIQEVRENGGEKASRKLREVVANLIRRNTRRN